MTFDEDASAHSEHVVEIPNESPATRKARRRSFATISVAVCLGLAGVVTAFAFVRDQSENAADHERDAVQREQLIDGWTTLAAVAASQRASDALVLPSNTAQPVATTQPTNAAPQSSPAPAAPTQTIIVVGSPAPAAVPQPIQSLPTQAAPVPVNPAPSSANTSSTNAPSDLPVMQAPTPTSPGLGTPGSPTSPPPGSPDTVLSPITYPASQSCGMSTCNVDSVCCNVSCGICTAPGESCSQKACG